MYSVSMLVIQAHEMSRQYWDSNCVNFSSLITKRKLSGLATQSYDFLTSMVVVYVALVALVDLYLYLIVALGKVFIS